MKTLLYIEVSSQMHSVRNLLGENLYNLDRRT